MTFFYRSDAAAADDVVAAARSAAQCRGRDQVDVRDSRRARDAVERVVERCGRVDILVNNAGVIRDNPLSAFDDADVADVLDTNVTGVFNVTRAVVPHMIAKRAGRIVNLSSVSGEKGGRGQTNYAASKGAINAFTRALAVELAPRKINVNGVAPGVIETEMSAAVRELAGDEVKSRILLRRFGTAGRGRVRGVVPRLRVRELRDGAGLQCRWRLQDGVTRWRKPKSQRKKSTRSTRPSPRRSPTRWAATSAEVKPDASLIEDLGAESIDFLDMVFRLERAFKVKIPRGKIVENARGTLTEGGVRAQGDRHRRRTRAAQGVPVRGARRALPHADQGEGHSAALHAGDLLQARHRGAAAGDGGGVRRPERRGHGVPDMGDHFAAFSFVDRIHDYTRGRARARRFTIPARLHGVPVVPRRRGRGPARVVGRDGAHRFSRPAGRGARPRDAVPARRASRARRSSSPSSSRAATTRRSPIAAGPTSTARARSS